MKLFTPYRGEFGILVWAHSPQVHAALEPGVDAVCCWEGLEALYPGAAHYVRPPALPDADRRMAPEGDVCGQCGRRDGCETFVRRETLPSGACTDIQQVVDKVHPDLDAPRKYFVPRPHGLQGVWADVVVCPRRREYGPDKNWPHWQGLIEALRGDGYEVFAGGAAETSYDVHGCARAWDYARPLDATIQAMHSARLVVATDAGLAHLAVVCGRPLLLITHGSNLVAPGADDRGRPYGPVKRERYEQENHTGSMMQTVTHGWTTPENVTFAARAWLDGDGTERT